MQCASTVSSVMLDFIPSKEALRWLQVHVAPLALELEQEHLASLAGATSALLAAPKYQQRYWINLIPHSPAICFITMCSSSHWCCSSAVDSFFQLPTCRCCKLCMRINLFPHLHDTMHGVPRVKFSFPTTHQHIPGKVTNTSPCCWASTAPSVDIKFPHND